MSGKLITLEGAEGVGKSTNLAFVAGYLGERGIDVVTTREPGGTALGERVRSWILDEPHGALGAEVETLLMFAARAHHLERVIRPALEAGRWVVCDRFTDATFAYQGGGRGADSALLRTLRTAIHRGLEPALTLLLDAPLAIGRERIGGRPADHFERESVAFFERVRSAYLALAAHEPERIKVIDATEPLGGVQAQIEGRLKALLADSEP